MRSKNESPLNIEKPVASKRSSVNVVAAATLEGVRRIIRFIPIAQPISAFSGTRCSIFKKRVDHIMTDCALNAIIIIARHQRCIGWVRATVNPPERKMAPDTNIGGIWIAKGPNQNPVPLRSLWPKKGNHVQPAPSWILPNHA